jgi:hypothetical protein
MDWLDHHDGWLVQCGVLFLCQYFTQPWSSIWQDPLGPSNIFSIFALGPAYVFGVLAIGALGVMGYHAVYGPTKTKSAVRKA